MLAVPFLSTISLWRGDKEMVIHWWMEDMPESKEAENDFEVWFDSAHYDT
jgi:hypothetical protein